MSKTLRKDYIRQRLMELALKDVKDNVDYSEEVRLQAELDMIESEEAKSEEFSPENLQKELDKMIQYTAWED